jgi:hypothetical protein
MRPIVDALLLRALPLALSGLCVWPAAVPARGDVTPDVAVEIARLRSRLADTAAREQHCLVGATQPVWTASLAGDLRALQDRAKDAVANGDTAQAQRWRELARKAEALEARAAVSARSGAELFQSQQIGLDCLERFAAEREALRASLDVAVVDPAAYGESLRRVREHGTAELDQDLTRLQGHCRALSAQWRQTRADASAGAQVLKAALDTLRRRHTAALESEPVRAAADPTLRAVEALVAAADAWQRERAAAGRLGAAGDDVERRRAAMDREESARLASGYWATADRLLARRVSIAEPTRTGTAWPGAGGTP